MVCSSQNLKLVTFIERVHDLSVQMLCCEAISQVINLTSSISPKRLYSDVPLLSTCVVNSNVGFWNSEMRNTFERFHNWRKMVFF